MFSSNQIGLGEIKTLQERISNRVQLTTTELKRVMSLDAQKRYEYFLQYCVQHHEVYGIFEGNDLYVYQADDWRTLLFPNETTSTYFLKELNIAAEAVPIPLNEFIDDLGPSIIDNSVKIEMFPSPGDHEVICIAFNEFVFDLVGAWEFYTETELVIDPSIKNIFTAKAKKAFFKRAMMGRPKNNLP